jgi:17beta-estradiol 17-dehydrogenase / very-long-chain 3-oxoacyl-CoA reductase
LTQPSREFGDFFNADLSHKMWFFYAFALYVAYRVASALYTTFIRGPKNLKKYGAWAVVTGATDGIGLAIANELARKQNLNIVLIARDNAKLAAAAADIEKEAKVQTQTIQVDFSNFDGAAQARVRAAVKDLDVGVLINNVGQSYNFPQYFNELEDDIVASLIDLNIQSTTKMIRCVLPIMMAKNRGAIVNMSSGSSLLGAPLLAEYAATKSYVNALSVGLHYEYKSKGIDVQVQTPLYVATKLAKIRNSSLTVPSTRAFAKASVRAIGYEPMTAPFWAHALMLYVASWLPESIVSKYVAGMHKAIRAKGMSKAKRSS